MSNWDRIRQFAREFHVEVCNFGDEKHQVGASAEILLAKAEKTTKIKRKGYRKGHPLLRGALARFERDTILFDNTVAPWLSLYHQAHEYGHIRLGHGERCCTASDIDSEAAEEKLPIGVHRVEGYGPQEQIECEANVFAREFLLPGNVLKEWFMGGLNAEQIAQKVGVSIEMVCHQLARALLTPDITTTLTVKASLAGELILDNSQKQAAEAFEGPLLIAAGPGTGKTRTLAGRVLYLLKSKTPKVQPESILILTFSNKAAEELRDRVSLFTTDDAQKIKIETFHSFGLDLLRKYGTKIGLPAKPMILDPLDALFLLERSLPQLNLNHYESLSDPTKFLNDILKAISRAKDENIGPTIYQERAMAMRTKALTPSEIVAAEKALEVAQVYTFYQEHLSNHGLLDFGDLLCRSIELLQKHPIVRTELRQYYAHVLVDEYQDVNRASGLLLKEIVGEGFGLWAVGDVRQSIHRWRGATTANMHLFAEDFVNAKPSLSLQVNYRSQPLIVDVFSEFTPHMRATSGVEFTTWQKERRNSNGTIHFEIAPDERTEAEGIARHIQKNSKFGIPFREQAIICRSHKTLARIAKFLEEEGIPILYLGDLFERPEIRDLLSLLSLTCEPDGEGLLRVARFPEYDILLSDVLSLRKLAKEKGIPFPKALNLASEVAEISNMSKEKLILLTQHLDDLCHGRSAWKTLTRYLFAKSSYLAPLLSDVSVIGQQRRLALFQLIQFAHAHLNQPSEGAIDPKRNLLKYIRRLQIYGEDRQFRQIPIWADNIDAVRMLTIHASKGLEFQAVFLPKLAKAYMPLKKGPPPSCPLPPEMAPNAAVDWHLEEEECLFFVALSRARDHLFLSCANRYLKSNCTPSEFLSMIQSQLPPLVDGQKTWIDKTFDKTQEKSWLLVHDPDDLPKFELRQLEIYQKCPRRYFYEFKLTLSSRRDDSGYVRFHQCVYETLSWIMNERIAGREPNLTETKIRLGEIWKSRGPIDHYYQTRYLDAANLLTEKALERNCRPQTTQVQGEYEVKLSQGRVVVKIDSVELLENVSGKSLLVQRHRTGKPTKEEKDHPIYGLYQTAMQQAYPQATCSLQALYLSTDETKDIILTEIMIKTRLQKYNNAIVGILQRHFPPNPDDYECPRCPHYFICPMGEDAKKA